MRRAADGVEGGVAAPSTAPGGPGRAARLLVAVVEFYRRHVSPVLAPRCRFHPTCSSYAVVSLRRHGALRGTGLVLRRLVRCQPFHPGGVDEVPPAAGRPGAPA